MNEEVLNNNENIFVMPEKVHEPKWSNELNELYAALAKAQGEMESASMDSSNPYFKSSYADLNSVIKASRPALTKNGLAVMQRTDTNGDAKMYLYTRLCHASGQWIESKMPINPPKSDIQSIGSYISYLRRYSYISLVGVSSESDDDDGEKAMSRENPQTINPAQKKELDKLFKQLNTVDQEKMLSWCQVDDVEKIPSLKFLAVKQALERKITEKGVN